MLSGVISLTCNNNKSTEHPKVRYDEGIITRFGKWLLWCQRRMGDAFLQEPEVQRLGTQGCCGAIDETFLGQRSAQI